MSSKALPSLFRLASASAAAGFLTLAAAGEAQSLVRIPQNTRDLSQAMRMVANNGVIEMAGGTYVVPAAGFSLSNNRKAFTIRAAAGATVILDGQGNKRLFRFKNNSRTGMKPVTFQRIVFRNGSSTTEGDAGGVTLKAAEARFEGCTFSNNVANPASSGGGAVRVFANSTATFANSRFEGNSSKNRGGAVAVEDRSGAAFLGSTFVRNRVNVPGHKRNSPGGAVYVLNSQARVENSLFEENQAGFAGGALYGFGTWTAPEATPRTTLTVIGSTFRNNSVANDPCCVPPGQTSGGAIHAEDQTTLAIERSFFTGNQAEFGGAVNAYRSLVDIRGTIFDGNSTPLGSRFAGVGGAVFLASVDFADASTQAGAINRRPARLTVAESLFAGRPDPNASANSGGCLFVGGDTNRVFGEGGVAASGSVADNRARAEIRKTVFADCDVVRTASNTGGSGGAIELSLADLTLEDSLLLLSDARGAGAFGGALSAQIDSLARVARTTFAENGAELSGGAVQSVGSTVEITEGRFFGNEIGPGSQRGGAVFSIPRVALRKKDVTGFVLASLFSANDGFAVFDSDPPGAGDPINDVRYDHNQFHADGGMVYGNTLAAPNGLDANGLNALTVFRAGRPATDKSTGPNTRLFGPPTAGTLLAVQKAGSSLAPAGGVVAFGWSGFSASLNGQALPFAPKAGLLRNLPAGTYTLAADGSAVGTATLKP